MRSRVVVLVGMLLACWVQLAAAQPIAVFVVSPDGNDAWSGTLDAPFATLTRAQQALRSLRRSRIGVVRIRAGTYELDAPLVLEAADARSRWIADGTVTFSGGRALTTWHEAPDGTWRSTVPAAVGDVTDLYVNGERRARPRLPQHGYFDALPAPSTIAHPEDVEVLAFHQWTVTRSRVRVKAGRFEFVTPIQRASTRFLLDNVREAHLPGQWFFDRGTREITYWPRPGEQLQGATFVVPRLATLVVMRGTAQAPVSSITFEGIRFAHTTWSIDGHEGEQAEVHVPAAIEVAHAHDIALSAVHVAHTGGYGIDIHDGSTDVTVSDSLLYDLGAGGIRIGDPKVGEDAIAPTDSITVRTSRIVGGGRIYPGAVGVWIGKAAHNTVSRNEIADFYYSGVSVGWTWGAGKSSAGWNLVTDNDIHDLGQGVMDDLGGVYTLGDLFGTAIRHNRIANVSAWRYGGWGIYFDEGSSGITAENNLVMNCESASVYQNYGSDNWVVNNILAFGEQAQIGHGKSGAGLVVERNLIMFKKGALLAGVWPDAGFDRNVYSRFGRPFDFAGRTLDAWQREGHDVHSFVERSDNDLTHVASRVASTIQFVPFDTKTFGPPDRIPRAPILEHAFPSVPLAPARSLDETFEATNVGQAAIDAVSVEEAGTRARVTNKAASSGTRSLELSRTKASKAREWVPYVAYDPRVASGTVQASFAMRVDPGSVAEHEWRDEQLPYHVGPKLHVSPDGTLEVGGKSVATVPLGKWFRVTIEMKLGENADGTWDLGLELPAAKTTTWMRGLHCDLGFQALRWFAFSAHGPDASTVYVDDIKLQPRP